MNKIIQAKQKVMIVKPFFIAFTLLLGSCSIQKNVLLLDIVLKDNHFQKSDSVYLERKTSNAMVIDFFKKRNTKHLVLYGSPSFSEQNNVDIIIIDSLMRPDGTYIVKFNKKIKVNRDEYIKKGKGVNKVAETFLKDTFNLTKDPIVWYLKHPNYNVFPEQQFLLNGHKLVVSRPVYNKKKNKAIICLNKSINRNSNLKKIYLLENINNKWLVVYRQESFINRIID